MFSVTSTDYIVDTSIFIAAERLRPLGDPPEGKARISIATLTELLVGVERAGAEQGRADRRETVAAARKFIMLPYDESVANSLAKLLASAGRFRRRAEMMDAIIAATALAHDLTVWTQDDDFAIFAEIDSRLRIHRV